ncbi:hypothetical protein [Streptococcus marimammalium]|uniref:hypothetical protein n=1 Tax=Streptococcus marimammalium TaxID=269666 RepID=UPI000379B85F|nr:hypothetical protein [Streptococcus marimammalium]
MSIYSDIENFFSDSVEHYITIEKNLEKQLIKFFYSREKLISLKLSEGKFDSKIKNVGIDSKEQLEFINSQFDASIKGEWSRKVRETVSSESKNYLDL